MKRVIFVGVHNKPGMTPLDSKSRSGKLIDRIIRRLEVFEPHVDYQVTCVKSNLFDLDYLPVIYDRSVILNKWSQRAKCSMGRGDVVVTLGACVHSVFKSYCHPINLGHPSGVWAKDKQIRYVRRALKKIRAAL